jgi:magnesium-transporting ATPase (P-type)
MTDAGSSTQVVHAGLTAEEATRRLARDGPNRLPVARPVPMWRRIVAQLVHFFAVMLWGPAPSPLWPACLNWAWRSSSSFW